MPYVESEHIFQPSKDRTTIWRYLQFEKFVSLVATRCLFFSSARNHIIGDRYEGVFTDADYMNLHSLEVIGYDALPEKDKQVFNGKDDFDLRIRLAKEMHEVAIKLRDNVFMNCWHASRHESAAMWSIYAKKTQGIAIESTIGSLKKSLNGNAKEIYIGKVVYIDYSRSEIFKSNILNAYLHKRKFFSYEREIRAIFMDASSIGDKEKGMGSLRGHYIDVDLDALINKIYVSPNSGKWFYNLVCNVINKYGVKKEVIFSQMAHDPLCIRMKAK